MALPVLVLVPKENSRAEDPFKGGNQSKVLLPAGMHPAALEHLGRRAKTDDLRLLLDRQGGQEYGHERILTEGNAVVRMASNLEDELTVASLIQELLLGNEKIAMMFPQAVSGRLEGRGGTPNSGSGRER